jgi:hypothetical protein
MILSGMDVLYVPSSQVKRSVSVVMIELYTFVAL